MKQLTYVEATSRRITDLAFHAQDGAVVDRRIWYICDALCAIADALNNIDKRLQDLENPQTDEDFK